MTPLIPLRKRNEYEKKTANFCKMTNKKLRIYPIFLKTPDSRFRNLLNPSILFRDWCSIFTTLEYLDPDAIICFYVNDAYPLVLLKKILGYSLFVVATGGDINLHEGLLYSLVRNLIYQHSDSVFAFSNELRDKIERESGYEAIVIPTGVDSSFFIPLDSRGVLREKWGFKQKDLVILTVCNLVKHKGVDIIIKSISILKNLAKHEIKLTIVGEGPERKAIEELASMLDLKQNVVFLGFRNREELLELYNIADLFVLASYSEGLPFVLLEAMACKSVCVSTNVGDIGKVITDGANGFLVDCGDPITLAEKIEKILSLPEDNICSIRRGARNTIVENFDFRVSTRTMTEIIAQY